MQPGSIEVHLTLIKSTSQAYCTLDWIYECKCNSNGRKFFRRHSRIKVSTNFPGNGFSLKEPIRFHHIWHTSLRHWQKCIRMVRKWYFKKTQENKEKNFNILTTKRLLVLLKSFEFLLFSRISIEWTFGPHEVLRLLILQIHWLQITREKKNEHIYWLS